MKDGRIAAKGSSEDIISADPELYEEIQQVSAVGWGSVEAESVEEERHRLKRSVSILSAGIDSCCRHIKDEHPKLC